MAVELNLLTRMLRAAGRQLDDFGSAEIPDDQLTWALEMGFGPLLLSLLENASTRLPKPQMRLLHAADQIARLKSAKFMSATTELIESCRNLQRPLVLLKGISIGEQFYSEPHLRAMGDIDLLVHQADLDSVSGSLLALGYEQRSHNPANYYLEHHHLMPFHNPRTNVCIEVHKSLLRVDARFPECKQFASSSVMAEMRPSAFQGRSILRFTEEFQLLYSATHWAREFGHCGRLMPLLDCTLIAQFSYSRLDWDRIAHWLKSEEVAIPLAAVLGYLQRFDIVALPAEIRRALEKVNKPATKLSHRILYSILESRLPDGAPFAEVLGDDNKAIICDTLLQPRAPRTNLALLPFHLLFPPQDPRRHGPRFQARRLASLVRRLVG